MAKIRKLNVSRIFQYGTRLFILVLLTYYAILHQLKGVLEAPNPHVFCPFGGLESLYKFVAAGGYIQKIMPATMVLLIGSILLAIFFNRAFCGWICPLGTLQMIFDRIARFFRIKKLHVPPTIEKYLHYIKYIGLVVILYFTWKIGDLVYSPYDPWATYAHIAAGLGELYEEFLIGSVFLVVALIGSLWLPNNFCRYFCPMGAFLAILSKLSPTKIYRNTTICINCKKCDRVCPAQIDISTKPSVKSMECFSCGDCVAACPVENTLFYNIRHKLPLKWFVYGIVTVVVFFGTVFISKQVGIWKTSYSSASEVLIDDSGVKNPANIKGSMTMETVSREFNVPVEAFMKKFNLSKDTNPEDMLKDIAKANNLEVEDFRTFIVEYIQQGEIPPGQTTAPETSSAVQPEQTPALEERFSEPSSSVQSESQPVVEEKTEKQTSIEIRGKTTIGELLGYGMTKEYFKEITGVEMPDDEAMILKDFADANGLDMETLKDQIIEALQQ